MSGEVRQQGGNALARGMCGVGLAGRLSAMVGLAFPTLGVLLALVLPVPAMAGSCLNEEVRAEQGAGRLPDCRAFELVTPEIKGDNGNFATAYGFPDGDHVEYAGILPMPGAGSGAFATSLSTRTVSGWVNTSLAPPATGPGEPIRTNGPNSGNFTQAAAFTGDFSQVFADSGFDTDPSDQDGAIDAYRLDLSSGAWSLAALPDTGPLTASFNSPEKRVGGTFIADVSENGSHVFFQTFDQLPVAPGTPSEPHPGDMVYDRTGGHTYMVGVLPDGTIPQTCSAGLGDGAVDAFFYPRTTYGAISPDGTNVVFTCGGEVYLRVDNATTIKLTGESYIARSSDGSKVFTGGVGGVFEYDVASGVTTTITPGGAFVASSADGSRVYYLGGGPEPGLYLWDKGTSVLISNAGEGFASRAVSGGEIATEESNRAVATRDGSRLLFLDRTSLTGYNNFGPKCVNAQTQPGFCAEAYVYDATTGAVTCVSCNPTGAPPLGNAGLRRVIAPDPLLPAFFEGQISPDGSRVFFETTDALVPQDTNGLRDVYEWEDGRIYLISSGQGTIGAILSGVSSNGDDVFVTTPDRLAPQDIETAMQIYDARVGGGFPYRPFVPGCDSGQCQGPQTPAPVFGAPASATFVGLGNPVPAVSAPTAVKAKPKAKHGKRPKAKHGKRPKAKHGKRPKAKHGKRSKAGRASMRTGGGRGEREGGK